MAIVRNIATIGGLTMVSRVLGMTRDILIAAILGAGGLADAFFVAFKLPNLFRRLFAEGAFNLAFVPLFAGHLEREGRHAGRRFAEESLAVLAAVLVLFVAVMEMAMPIALVGFAPGFVDDPQKFDLTVTLTRITFPYLLFVSLVSLMAGVLNSLGRFAAAAATPVLLNLCLIGALLGLTPVLPSPAHALAWGVALAGVVQLLWLLWACARGDMVLRLPRPRMTVGVRKLLRRLLPVALGAGVYQINLLVDMIIASFLPSGSISYLFYADRVTQLPLGVVGVAVGTALLPTLSRQLTADRQVEAADSQNRALEFACLLTLPAAAALLAIPGPVISVLLERGAFGPAQAAATSAALAVYAAGLPAFVLVKVLAPGYFAREDTATPVKIAVGCMGVNLVLALLLMGPFLHVGLAMATAASSWLNAGLMAFILHRRGHLKTDDRLRRRLPRMLVASAAMGTGLWAAAEGLSVLLLGDFPARFAGLCLLVAGGLAAFAVLAQVLGAARLQELRSNLRRGPA